MATKVRNISAGLDEEEEQPAVETEATEEVAEKKAAFSYWTVGGKDYKLKLTTEQVMRLETKYGKNPITLIMSDDMPPLSVMLTFAQAALTPWHHGIKYEDVRKLYDRYLDEGGSMTDFYNKILGRCFAISGFFSRDQKEAILKEIDAE
jgi:hypothetical protein